MSVLHCFNATPSLSSQSFLSSTLAISATPISRLPLRPIGQNPTSFNGIRSFVPLNVRKSGVVIVRASSETDETGPNDAVEPPSDNKEVSVPIDKLPLESKLQERMEQKMKMKMAKKIRLRRKRLVRKRRLRKKGRWPPSKMKKLKNV
ncbi:50S ribosomal protein 5 chloroplastic [Tripterygium wilfordii]|uniref:50S ribosomal protein 5 chloroplastic n=1 Tax=Tripterygium wilfordii TaxID=458696 RepID=A0A7J7CU08_TRIWF|nr:50S ribosomal protein 5 alpha, chloroplastic-like [Tripterygium wilfordii]KAF5737602.1 50S ribosomal protein 5 chloroplastic [Tripterygium wilfordii]